MQKKIPTIENTEQQRDKNIGRVDSLQKESYCKKFKRPNDEDALECFSFKKEKDGWHLSTSYFIGVDWLDIQKSAIRITSKFNHQDSQVEVDCLKMLENTLKEPENFQHLEGLLEVDFDVCPITIPRKEDFLSLFLISEYVHLLAHITSKGLKKAYYFVEENKRSKLKGKLLLVQNIKRNNFRGNFGDNYCRFQEYGINIPENQLLKKAMLAVAHFLDGYDGGTVEQIKSTLSGICPYWKEVDVNCDESKICAGKVNPFFKEYSTAINLAKLILRKMSFNQVVHGIDLTTTPPYWIDMSKLFEMYVFSKLRERFGKAVVYHPHFGKQEPDFLLFSDGDRPAYIIDAKYKQYGKKNIEVDDIRQVSGYARMKAIRKNLGVSHHHLLPCLIVFPQHNSNTFLPNHTDWEEEGRYLDIYKIGIQLPIIQNTIL